MYPCMKSSTSDALRHDPASHLAKSEGQVLKVAVEVAAGWKSHLSRVFLRALPHVLGVLGFRSQGHL